MEICQLSRQDKTMGTATLKISNFQPEPECWKNHWAEDSQKTYGAARRKYGFISLFYPH